MHRSDAKITLYNVAIKIYLLSSHIFFRNRAYDNGENNSDQKIYAYMARMPDNEECPSGNFGDSLQLTNWILDLGATCHMTPQVLDFFQVR